ncbi:ligase-associated DNA damage response endonuclease PdeM [Salinisphaera aquimarina]|uniref:Ligase-associated DNA damage response endonuclease PdeM n=1 Tax=Salinisphaera aquimarina TaxID=2094031 RepID=A0ABV7ER72_9GAMM
MTLTAEQFMQTSQAELTLAGERLLLRADHSVYWPARSTLLVADTHFGKSGVFRRQGMGLPSGTTDADLARLGAALDATGARRLIILGDFVHAPPTPDEPWLARFAEWQARFAGVQMIVTRGNHDRTDRLPADFDIRWHAGSLFETPFVLQHEPGADARGPVLAGHLHPVVRLGAGSERLRAPVFWRNADALVLPAFCSFAGGGRIAPVPGDRLFVVGEGQVVEADLGVDEARAR